MPDGITSAVYLLSSDRLYMILITESFSNSQQRVYHKHF